MLNYKRNLMLDLFDYSGNKLCTLYDSTSDISGQAANVIKKTERNGWKQLSFTIPSKCEDESGKQVDNYRLDFLKADYKIRATEGQPDKRYVDWYLIQEPKITHKNFSKDVSVTADHVARLLKTKNLGLEFSDKEGNNVGTAEELLATILDGTGWQPGSVAKFYEKYDAEKEKVRSLKAASKTGAFKMISSMCDLFEAKPIYNGDTKTVDIVPMNPFSKPVDGELPKITDGHAIELHYGKNLKNISRTLDTENMVTKLYCYGAYGDKTSGYCGIDEWHHLEYKFSATLTAGQEYRIAERDELANIEYIRYFTAKHSGSYTLIWSMLDPASMRYVWNEEEGKAYRVYETPQQASATTLENPTKETVINQVSYLMDFDYYDAVGLLSDEMLQTIAEYQRGMPALLKASTEAAAAFNESLDKLSSTVGSVNFCKLAVSNYSSFGEDGYLQLNLNVNDYPNKGIIYRTDYTTKERDQFKWRVAKELKENGDPVHTVASILYIIHTNYDPVRFDLVYLHGINGHSGDAVTEDDIDHPTTLSLWTKYADFDKANLDKDEIYLFQANTINGLLGALEASDEAAVTALDNATEQVTVKHPVYFSRKNEAYHSLGGFEEYAWTWVFDDTVEGSENMLYFFYKQEGDNNWYRVYFAKDTLPTDSGVANGQYCYVWQESMLYRRINDTWAPLNETTQQSRVVSAFGTVWQQCQIRDRLYKGTWEYYEKTIAPRDVMIFGDGSKLPVGNYAIKETDEEWTTWHAFTTTRDLSLGEHIGYDTTNKWIVITKASEDYWDMPMEKIIDDTIKCKDFRFDNVFYHDEIKPDTWTQGSLQNAGDLKPHSKIIYEGGGEIDSDTDYRTGFLGIYPNVEYGIKETSGSGSSVIIHFYTMEHSYLGMRAIDNLGTTETYFTSPANARFMRWVTSSANRNNFACAAKNHESAFVTDEKTYYILGKAEPYDTEGMTRQNQRKGIVPLMKLFYETADQAYLRDLKALETAQADVKKEEDEVVTVLGDVYREGYWQKADYVDGDEDKLYYDGLENLRKIAQPESKYDIQYLDLYDANTAQFNYAVDETANVTYWPDLEADWGVHIVDPEIGISQWGFIDTLQKCYDQPWKTTISVNTNLSTIAQHSFTDVMTHIAEVAKQTNAKMEMYDRADAFSSNGSMPASNLEGVIDANKLVLTGGSSTWYTDKNGNMVFESGDGKSAMTLTGNGFCIANNKDASGEWDWNVFGTGDGFVADYITAGTLDAKRVITNQLMSYMNENLVLSSNESIMMVTGEINTSILDQLNAKDKDVNEKLSAAVATINQNIIDLTAISYDKKKLDDELNSRNYATVQVTDDKIKQEVGKLQTQIKTTMELDTAGLHLRQGDGAKYEALFTSEELAFVLTDDPTQKVATFGATGATADRLKSNKQLSVGTKEDGWFDFIMVQNGLAEKWRTEKAVVLPPSISKQPESAAGNNVVVLSVEGTGEVQWQRSPDGDGDWSNQQNTSSDPKKFSVTLNGINELYVYRCILSDSDGNNAVVSDQVSAFNQNAPAVFTSVSGTTITAITLGTVDEYQWYVKNDSTWSKISGETSRSFIGMTGNVYRCSVHAGNYYGVSNIITL